MGWPPCSSTLLATRTASSAHPAEHISPSTYSRPTPLSTRRSRFIAACCPAIDFSPGKRRDGSHLSRSQILIFGMLAQPVRDERALSDHAVVGVLADLLERIPNEPAA